MAEILKLKVHKNKRTGQASIVLPKKKFKGGVPEFIGVIKKDLFYNRRKEKNG